MAYLRFEPNRRRVRVSLVAGRSVNGRVVQERIGNLGSIIAAEIGAAPERARFWRQLAERFSRIEAKFPGRFSPQDSARFEAAVAKRIRRPTKAESHQCFHGGAERGAPTTGEHEKRQKRRASVEA